MEQIKTPQSMQFAPIPAETEHAAKLALNAAYKVHTQLGPGLLELVYETCLTYEIRKSGAHAATQVVLPVIYDGIRMEAGLRLDLLVENLVIIELKSVDCLLPLHESQLLTYLKLTGLRLGLLINFNVPHLKDGIRRLVY